SAIHARRSRKSRSISVQAIGWFSVALPFIFAPVAATIAAPQPHTRWLLLSQKATHLEENRTAIRGRTRPQRPERTSGCDAPAHRTPAWPRPRIIQRVRGHPLGRFLSAPSGSLCQSRTKGVSRSE